MKYNIGDNLLINAASKANVEKILHELTEDTENGTAGEFIRGWNAALRAVKEKMEMQGEGMTNYEEYRKVLDKMEHSKLDTQGQNSVYLGMIAEFLSKIADSVEKAYGQPGSHRSLVKESPDAVKSFANE